MNKVSNNNFELTSSRLKAKAGWLLDARLAMGILIATVLLMLTGCRSVPTKTPSTWSKENVLELMKSERVNRITVYYFREDALLSEAMNERDLERIYSSCIIINENKDLHSRFRDRLIDVVSNSSMVANDRVSRDLRWGCVFTDLSGNRILSLYFASGRSGVVNDASVMTDGKVVALLRAEFGCVTDNW